MMGRIPVFHRQPGWVTKWEIVLSSVCILAINKGCGGRIKGHKVILSIKKWGRSPKKWMHSLHPDVNNKRHHETQPQASGAIL